MDYFSKNRANRITYLGIYLDLEIQRKYCRNVIKEYCTIISVFRVYYTYKPFLYKDSLVQIVQNWQTK